MQKIRLTDCNCYSANTYMPIEQTQDINISRGCQCFVIFKSIKYPNDTLLHMSASEAKIRDKHI